MPQPVIQSSQFRLSSEPFFRFNMRNFLCIVVLLCCQNRDALSVAPEPKQNYVPVVLVDSTGLNTPGSIYFVAHALDPCGLPCYLVPGTDGVCEYVYPQVSGSPSSADPSISKTLSDLPLATGTGQTDTAYLIYIPIDSSARGYLSIENPMYLPTKFNTAPTRQVLDIIDSSITSIQDPNYYTWYQDFEFGLVYINSGVSTGANLASQLFMNLSWVDYFCLPMRLEVFSYPSNDPISGISTFVSGFDPTTSRDSIIQNLIQGLKSEDTSISIPTWSNVSVPYYANQYASASIEGYVRILAAKNSIALDVSNVYFQGPYTGAAQKFFPSDYIHNTIYGTDSSTTYMEAVYNFYAIPANALTVQIFPAGGVASVEYLYEMTANGGDVLTFTYTGAAPPSGPTPPPAITLVLTNLTTEQLLSGSLWAFTPDDLPFTNELSKFVSALFSISQLPLTSTLTAVPPTDLDCTAPPSPTTFVNNNCGFARISIPSGKTDSYFQKPPITSNFKKGPWYNVYDEVLHTLQSPIGNVPNNPSYGLGYGYDYDDLLNMAGLIDPLIQDQYGTPSENGTPSLPDAYIVITLGNLVGTTPLNINNDTYTTNPSGYMGYEIIPYPIQIGTLNSETTMEVNFLWYDGTNQHVTPAPADAPTTLANIVVDQDHPFQIQFKYNDITYTYNINLLRQVVIASSPTNPFSTIDQTLMLGIIFELTTGTPDTIVINISSVAPPWPG